MRIIGISTARNEEDVIEASVRHNLSHCDELLVINHGSTDSTLAILESLQSEGLPLTVITDTTLGDVQTLHMNRLLKMAVDDFAADWILCLDSDEFIQGPLQSALREQMGKNDDHYYRLRIVNFQAQPGDRCDALNPTERITHREEGSLRPDPVWTTKIAIPRALAKKEGAFIGKGNHQVFVAGFAAPYQWLDEVHLAHFPIRSPSQFGSKLISKVYSKLRQRGPKTGNGDHYEKPYREMRNSFSAFVENFHQTRASWVSSSGAIPLLHAPAEYLGGELRYTPKQHDVDQLIRNILDLAEELAATPPPEEAPAGDYNITLAHCDPLGVSLVTPTVSPIASTSFAPLRLSLSPRDKQVIGPINIAAYVDRGVIEISELIVHYDCGGSDSYPAKAFNRWLTVNEKGLKVHGTTFVRLCTGGDPIIISLVGRELFSKGTPTGITFLARLFADTKRMTNALFNPLAIRQLRLIPSEAIPKIRYPIGRWLSFDDDSDGVLYLREGWSTPQNWGSWSVGPFAAISLRLEKPIASPLALKIQLRRRKGIPVRVRLILKQETIGTWLLEDDRYQTLEATIPGTALDRYALELIFQIDPPENEQTARDLAIGIKSLHIEERPQYPRLLKAACALCLPAADFIRGAFDRNRIALGEEIGFHQQGRGAAFLGDGWEPPTSSGCLMERRRASLILRFPRSKPGPLLLKLFVRKGTLGSKEGSLTAEIEGRKIANWMIATQEGQWLDAVIPASASRGSCLKIELRQDDGTFELSKLSLQQPVKNVIIQKVTVD